MRDVFLVLNDRGFGDPWVVYVSGEKLPDAENFDPRPTGAPILAEVEVGLSFNIGEASSHPQLVQALARLDSGTRGDTYRRTLAGIFKMGMMAQRAMDQKKESQITQDVANGGR